MVVMNFLRWLHGDEGGFLQFLIPGLILSFLQGQRQKSAQADIDQAEEAEIPLEESQIKETLALRGMSNTSAYAGQVGEPRRQYNVNKKVGRAKAILSQPTVDPLTIAFQYLAGKMGKT